MEMLIQQMQEDRKATLSAISAESAANRETLLSAFRMIMQTESQQSQSK
jgi:hypothetical protein